VLQDAQRTLVANNAQDLVEDLPSELGIARAPAPAPVPELAEGLEPSAAWWAAGMRFLEEAEAVLWSVEGERARAYLHGRGLNDETLRASRIGFQPEEGRRGPAEHWGFPARANDRPGWVRIPRGIVLPWLLDSQLWQLKIRTNREQPKYLAIGGGHPCWRLTIIGYRWQSQRRGLPVKVALGVG
jgi:hypothetical protein